MSIALPPALPQPAAAQSRDAAGALGIDTQRHLRGTRDAETARVPLPVDAAPRAADLRLQSRRDEPVGPPPAFAINVLDHLRETAFDPPEPAAEEAEPRARRDDADHYASAGHPPQDDGVALQVDLKL
jgi:hypothetical protein